MKENLLIATSQAVSIATLGLLAVVSIPIIVGDKIEKKILASFK